MVSIDDFAIEGDASVLTESPRYGIHIDHDLDTVRRTRLSCLDFNYRANTTLPSNQVRLDHLAPLICL